MKLAEYLVDYLANGIDGLHEAGLPMDFSKEGLESVIEDGIKAFISTQGKSASIDIWKRCECGRFFKTESYK